MAIVTNISSRALYQGSPGEYLDPGEKGEIGEPWLDSYKQKGWVEVQKPRRTRKKKQEADNGEAPSFI